MSKQKISAAQAAAVYAEVPGVLRSLASERDELRVKLASANRRISEFEERDRIEKIAQAMAEKGLDTESTQEERVERIKEAAAKGKSLDVIEEAVGLAAPQSGGLGELGKEAEVGNGATDLEAYLLGQVER